MKIAAILAEGFEETEFIAVTDLLRRASLDVLVVSSTGNLTVSGAHDFKIEADSLWDDVEFEDVDCIFLPGGMPGVTNLQLNKKVVETVQRFTEQDKFICAICAAPLVLDDAGILDGKKFTCYPSTVSQIKSGEYCDKAVVADGKIITGKGVGTALDLGLAMVAVFCSEEKSESLKKAIVYGV